MATPQVQSISCPNCGGSVKLRGYGQSLSAVCIQCLSVLDVRDNDKVRVLQQFQAKERVRPAIPLGTRGTLDGAKWETIGFQVREVVVDDETYAWREYLLFNPYQGFRYLSEYDGHWNRIRTVRELPQEITSGGRPAAVYRGSTFKHFQTSVARTTYVMGEFPWQVKVGDAVQVADYIAPPEMLSAERTENEVTWSLGTYTEPEEIWKAFALPGAPPPKVGVYSNQPAPRSQASGGNTMWGTFKWLLLALVVVAFGLYFGAGRREVFRQHYTFTSTPAAEGTSTESTDTTTSTAKPNTPDTGTITPQFDVRSGNNLEIEIKTDLSNDWAYFNVALINATTGEPRDFGREVSYYSGRDSDGSWSEGDRETDVAVLDVAPGRYYLRIDPEMETKTAHTVQYDIVVRSDVPTLSFFWIALVLLFLPPLFRGFKGAGFEAQRWAQSDYAS